MLGVPLLASAGQRGALYRSVIHLQDAPRVFVLQVCASVNTWLLCYHQVHVDSKTCRAELVLADVVAWLSC